jgi:hypothetical protein
MSSSHREISQTGQAYPEGSSHGWSASLEVKKKKTQDKRTGNSGDKGFLSKPGGCLHTSTQEKPGREKTKKQRTRENSKTVTGLMDQHSHGRSAGPSSTTPDYFFADRVPRPAARSSSYTWRSMFDRRAASERERWLLGAIEGPGPKGSEDDRMF